VPPKPPGRPPVPPSASWDLGRDLDQPVDEVFGLIDADELDFAQQEEPKFGRAQIIANKTVKAVEGLMRRLPGRGDDRDRQEELDELWELQQSHGTAAPAPQFPPHGSQPDDGPPAPPMQHGGLRSNLEQHLVHLPSNRDWQEFLQAEQQASLFEEYEHTRAQHLRSGALGLWVSTAVFVLLAVMHAQSYIKGLLDKHIEIPEQLLKLAGDRDLAHEILFVAGMCAPLLAFVLCAFSVSNLLQGFVSRSLTRLISGGVGVTAAAVSVMFAANGSYVQALIAPVAGWVAARLLGRGDR